jgi:hypothetical protein
MHRTTPFQLSTFRAGQTGIAELNLLLLEVAKHRPHRAQFLKLIQELLQALPDCAIKLYSLSLTE